MLRSVDTMVSQENLMQQVKDTFCFSSTSEDVHIGTELAETVGTQVQPSSVLTPEKLVRSGLVWGIAAKMPYLQCENKTDRLKKTYELVCIKMAKRAVVAEQQCLQAPTKHDLKV